MKGVVDFGEYALVESPIALTGADVVDLGELKSTLVGYRRSMALALKMDERALDAAPDVRRAIFQAHTITRPAGVKTLMPRQDKKMNLWLDGKLIHQVDVKAGNCDEWVEVQKRYQADYAVTVEAMQAKRLGAWLRQWPGQIEQAFIPEDMPFVKAVKPSTSYSDAFPYANSNLEANAPWIAMRGVGILTVVSNTVRCPTGGTFAPYLYDSNLSTDDMLTKADIVSLASGQAGVLTRAQQPGATTYDDYHFFIFLNAGHYYRYISVYTNGTATNLSAVQDDTMSSYPSSVWGKSNGSDHTIYFGGVEYETVSDATYSGQLVGGIYEYNPSGTPVMDNWSVEDLTPPGNPWYYYAQQ